MGIDFRNWNFHDLRMAYNLPMNPLRIEALASVPVSLATDQKLVRYELEAWDVDWEADSK